jgi:alpha-D-ribose 1-methylphosphonate 5-triphosphate diphosphatase
MPHDMILTNARIVLADEVIEGSVAITGGVITDIGANSAHGQDVEGDFILPGLVELHTDHIQSHYAPRPRVRWNPVAAVQAHDAQVAASGITTVFDALQVGAVDEDGGLTHDDSRQLADAIETSSASDRLRAEHFIHLRCEVSAPDCLTSFEGFDGHRRVRLASLMDHAPGQRQFTNIEGYRVYYQGKRGMNDAVFAAFCERRHRESQEYADRHRCAVAALCRDRGIVMASHDDATRAHAEEAQQAGVSVAEFPTTLEAAEASRDAGMAILMGAPNVVRGASHSGNVSARELAEKGLLDILSSDYVPFSLMQAAFQLEGLVDGISLPAAVALVSKTPARALGLDDRGEIASGKRADLVRVRIADSVPVVRTVWREGGRVI